MQVMYRIDQTVEQLVSLAVYMKGDGESPEALATVASETRAIAQRVKNYSLDGQALNREILIPLREQLIARYGPADGRALHDQLVRLYRDQGPM